MLKRPSLSTTERLRLFTLHGRICHICERPIDGVRDRWEIEHVIPRSVAGTDADTDTNMRPAHERCHKGKTKQDRDVLAHLRRVEAKHNGAHRSRHPFPWSHSGLKRRVDGTVVRRDHA